MKMPSRRRKGRLQPLGMISILSLVLVSLVTGVVFAENDFDTPGITDNSLNIWNTAVETPDGDLTYMFDGAGKYPGLIRHIIKDARSGHIYSTRVKVYYSTPPAAVTVNTVGYPNMCFFNHPNSGERLNMSIGATTVYSQPAFNEGQRIDGRTEYWKFDGNTGNRTLRTPPTANSFRDRNNSRVCRDIGGEAYTVDVYEELCGSRGGDTTCNGADTDNNFSLGDYRHETRTDYNPPISANCGGGTCRFADRTFSAPWAPDGLNMGYEPATGLYFALVNVWITGQNINDEDNANQIRFKLNAPGSYAIGHQSNIPASGFGTRFGLGNQIAVNTAQPNRGVKLALPFGMYCNEAAATRSMTIGLYDADRDTFANTYMYVVERDPETDVRRRIPVTEFTGYSKAIPQTYRFIADNYTYEDGDAATSTITFVAKKGMQYMFLVVNPAGQAGQNQEPGQNVFSVGLPTDSMPGLVNCKYELEPFMDIGSDTFEYTPNFRVHGWINNNKPGTVIGGDRQWQVNKLVFNSRPANMHGPVMNSGEDPCTRMRSGNTGFSPSCQVLNAQAYPGASDWDRNPYTEATTYPAGTYICFMTSILQPRWDSTPSQWAHSTMRCAASVKYPSMGVGNGNIRTGGSFSAPCNVNIAAIGAGQRYGYFGIIGHDYGGGAQHNYVNGSALAPGDIRNFASLTNGLGTGVYNMRGHFARGPAIPPSPTGGRFYGDIATANTIPGGTHCLSPVFADDRYPTAPATVYTGGTRDVTINPAQSAHAFTLNSGAILGLNSFNVGPSQRVVVRVNGNGTLILRGNISYVGSATDIYQLPQFTLLADDTVNVIVDDGVARLDGIYAGKNNLYTCRSYTLNNPAVYSTGKSWVNTGQCTTALRVNGAVIMGGRLFPYRTAGHTNPADTAPAEIVTLRPDILLSDYADTPPTPGLDITSQQELAPRY
jgi:hypothetical protein